MVVGLDERLVEAARAYIARGWVPIALGADGDGKPKRPLAKNWQELTCEGVEVRRQGWRSAIGIGVLCGRGSGNLAVLDIDDASLAAAIFSSLARSHARFRWVWTGRNNGHLYFREAEPSPATRFKVPWEGRQVTVEFRTTGNQVAAPPTPGYVLAREEEPTECKNIREAWNAIAHNFGLDVALPSGGRAGYPAPWEERVTEGQRNDSLFIEACRLAAARMPMEQAERIILARISLNYNGHLSEREVRATIHSAYRKAWAKARALTEEFADELAI